MLEVILLKHMGRSYLFECSRCGYRAKVSGRADRGRDFWVQTISCRDCKELYDAVVRLRVAVPVKSAWGTSLALGQKPLGRRTPELTRPPSFLAALNRLPVPASKHFRWVRFRSQCPASPHHRVELWTSPGGCPKCGLHLDQTVLPFRLWD